MFSCDVSEFQPRVDDTYPYRWLIFRLCDGNYSDHNAAANLAWCERARAAGRLDGYTVYAVYRPGQNNEIMSAFEAARVPADAHVMIDVESWGGDIVGDHSAEINQLAELLAARHSRDLVWGYGNSRDLAAIWPGCPDWVRLIRAHYAVDNPGGAQAVGWQYTDGSTAYPTPPGYPTATAPFGPCDHNELFLPAPQPARPAPRPAQPVHPTKYRSDMPIIVTSPQRGIAELVDGGKYHLSAPEWNALNAIRVSNPGAFIVKALTMAQWDALAEKRGKI